MCILCIGQAAYDITFPIDEPIVENQKYRIMEKIECMGGPAGNASYLCARWGADAVLQARIGDDIYGHKILNILESAHVDTSCIYVDSRLETSISGIIANRRNGHRTVFNCPQSTEPIAFHMPNQPVDVILVDGHEPAASFEALKQYPDAISIIDAGTLREAARELSKRVDYLICSQDFAYQFTNIYAKKDRPDAWPPLFKKLHELNHHHIAVTMGEEGLLYEDETGIHAMDAYRVKAVDTCGAGDIFHGAFAYCMANDYPFADALKISSMTSAISVESYGSQLSVPDKRTVNERLLKELENLEVI